MYVINWSFASPLPCLAVPLSHWNFFSGLERRISGYKACCVGQVWGAHLWSQYLGDRSLWVETRVVYTRMARATEMPCLKQKNPAVKGWGSGFRSQEHTEHQTQALGSVIPVLICEMGGEPRSPEAHRPLVYTAVNKRFWLEMKSKGQHPRLSSDLHINTQQAHTCMQTHICM